jgi:hypothetical protein
LSQFISLGIASFISGALLLFVALTGGNLEIKQVRLAALHTYTRVAAGALGAIFVILSVWVTFRGAATPEAVADRAAESKSHRSTQEPVGSTPTTSPEPFPTIAEQQLLTHIPEQMRDGCRRDDEPTENAEASIECEPGAQAERVWYASFRGEPQLNEWYFDHLANEDIIKDTSGECSKRQLEESAYTRVRNGPIIGRYTCYQAGGGMWMAWTNSQLHIAGLAYRADLDADTLYEWWLTAGPV